jgi:hypothetical protein
MIHGSVLAVDKQEGIVRGNRVGVQWSVTCKPRHLVFSPADFVGGSNIYARDEVVRRQDIVVVVSILMPANLELLEVVKAGNGSRPLFGARQRRQEQASQDGNDGDDHQKLDERERGPRLDAAERLPFRTATRNSTRLV